MIREGVWSRKPLDYAMKKWLFETLKMFMTRDSMFSWKILASHKSKWNVLMLEDARRNSWFFSQPAGAPVILICETMIMEESTITYALYEF